MTNNLSPEEERLLSVPNVPPVKRVAPPAQEPQQQYAQRAPQRPAKRVVTPEEYARSLARSEKRDMALLASEKDKRIGQSLKEWKRKVGPRFAGATTDHPAIIDRVHRIETGRGTHQTSLVLHGNLGAGKTWSAYAYINLALKAGVVQPGQIIADTETAVLGKIATGGFLRNELREELLNPRYKMYFIDDVGQGYFGAAAVSEQNRTEIWYELIDHVYSHDLTLIMTTNKTVSENSLGSWLGIRSYDRLKAIVGPTGLIEPGKVNRRQSVALEREQEYRG